MTKVFVFLLVINLILCVSCGQNSSSTDKSEARQNDTTQFFQVSQYLQSQIAEVNKTPYYIYKVDVINGKKDSSAINTTIFNQISKNFLEPDITTGELKRYYTENIFHDQTTNSFTVNYSTRNKELEVQNVDILLAEDGKTITRVFIRKFFNYRDSSAIEQLSWKPGQSFQINRLVQTPDNKENTYETRVVWNEKS